MAEFDPAAELRHYDRWQLELRIAEIFSEGVYLRRGVALEPGSLVFDVGANVGVAATFFASRCEAGVDHSFEPVAPLHELLVENTRRFAACVPHGYGLASQPGTAEITFYRDTADMSGLHAHPERDRALLRQALINSGRSPRSADEELADRLIPERMSCELRTLSSVIRELSVERVDLLKIDVEWAELDVIKGLAAPDWQRIRQLVAEVHDRSQGAAIGTILRREGFHVAWEQDELLRGTPIQMLYATRG